MDSNIELTIIRKWSQIKLIKDKNGALKANLIGVAAITYFRDNIFFQVDINVKQVVKICYYLSHIIIIIVFHHINEPFILIYPTYSYAPKN